MNEVKQPRKPLIYYYSIAMVILLQMLPTMEGNLFLQFLMTWVILFAMVCNGLLTTLAMQRYALCQTQPEPSNMIEEFLDERHGDDWMESRWPNMKLTTETASATLPKEGGTDAVMSALNCYRPRDIV